jgi:NADPH-dependent 2,4-dienoyl-CoA reductase/sulfur reductase-like enzyme
MTAASTGSVTVPHYTHLIIGGGMTAAAAMNGIREVDSNVTIGLIGAETHPPYNRPPLSKGLWKGEPLESIWRDTPQAGVTLHLGRRATRLEPASKRVTDDLGAVYTFDKLLLATGGSPRRLSLGFEDVIYFRGYDDYRRLRALADERLRFAVIGGGFIGSEIAAALRMQEREVVMLMPEQGPGARVFPGNLSHSLVEYFRDKGVEMRTGDGLAGLEASGRGVTVETTAGDRFETDVVVAGLGIEPNVDLARQAGLTVENGVVVDELLRTNHPDIFAAGDVANFYNPTLGTRMRTEHEDNANTMGRQAGRNMAGELAAYHHLPFFYSDLFDLGYEAVGDVDATLQTVADWKVPFREGVVYYLRDGRVRGVLLWNVWGQVDAARQLIAEPGPFTASSLAGRLPA